MTEEVFETKLTLAEGAEANGEMQEQPAPKAEEQAKEGETKTQEPTVAQPAPADDSNKHLKRWKDVAASAKGEAAALAKALNKLAEDGLVDFEEAAKVAGIDAKTLQNLTQGRGVATPLAEAEKQFSQQYALVKPLLAKTMQENPDEVLQAFDWLGRQDADVVDEFTLIPETERVAYVMEKGREVLADFREAKAHGGNTAAMAKKLREENAALKAQLEALKTGKKEEAPKEDDEGLDGQPTGKMSLTAGALPKPIKQGTADRFGDIF